MEPGFGITYRYDKTTNSGGILATVKIGLWTLIGNKNTRLILGVIYAPKENTTLNKELKKMHNVIKQHIQQAKQ